MKKTICILGLATIAFTACNKKEQSFGTEDFTTTETAVLNNFTDNVAIPQYQDLAAKSNDLYTALNNLNTSTTDANLATARTAWLNLRTVWERCEGFLFGPVEDDNYDPNMDTWPTDYVQMDSLMSSTATLGVAAVQNFTLSLRGLHPIEYIIFGNHGNRTAASITARQKEYLMSLADDVRSNCNALSNSWSTSGGNYGALVKTAGTGSTKYTKRLELFQAMTDGLIDIADEVGTSKMEDPYVQQNAQLVESPYSGNSVADFKNNIIGLQNVYLGRYTATGKGLKDIVAANNTALDNKIQTQIASAISSFDNITIYYEDAIFTQKTQIVQTQQALATLRATLEDELKPYLAQYIKD